MTNANLAKAIRNNWFADRKTVSEAYEYALEVMNTLRGSDKAAAITAMQVLMNTISNEILANEKKKKEK